MGPNQKLESAINDEKPLSFLVKTEARFRGFRNSSLNSSGIVVKIERDVYFRLMRLSQGIMMVVEDSKSMKSGTRTMSDEETPSVIPGF